MYHNVLSDSRNLPLQSSLTNFHRHILLITSAFSQMILQPMKTSSKLKALIMNVKIVSKGPFILIIMRWSIILTLGLAEGLAALQWKHALTIQAQACTSAFQERSLADTRENLTDVKIVTKHSTRKQTWTSTTGESIYSEKIGFGLINFIDWYLW